MTETAENIDNQEEVEVSPYNGIPTGKLIDKLYDLKVKRAALTKEASRILEEFEILSEYLLTRMKSDGTPRSSGHKASVTISKEVHPNLNDWEDFWDYCVNEGASHLIQRRPSAAACRELFDSGEEIPGISKFEKTILSLRKS